MLLTSTSEQVMSIDKSLNTRLTARARDSMLVWCKNMRVHSDSRRRTTESAGQIIVDSSKAKPP